MYSVGTSRVQMLLSRERVGVYRVECPERKGVAMCTAAVSPMGRNERSLKKKIVASYSDV